MIQLYIVFLERYKDSGCNRFYQKMPCSNQLEKSRVGWKEHRRKDCKCQQMEWNLCTQCTYLYFKGISQRLLSDLFLADDTISAKEEIKYGWDLQRQIMSPNPVQGTFVPSPLPGTQLSLKPPESRPLCIALFCHGRFKLNSPHSPKLLLKPPPRGFNIYLDKRIMPLQKPSCRASCRL